jgi:hypothetical protein
MKTEDIKAEDEKCSNLKNCDKTVTSEEFEKVKRKCKFNPNLCIECPYYDIIDIKWGGKK